MKYFSVEIAAIILSIVVISIFVVFWIRKQDHIEREAQKLMPPPGEATTEEDVIRLANAGHKIAAIKMYREIHDVGLAESKSAVEALVAHGDHSQVSQDRMPPPGQPAADEEVIRLAKAGQKIEAIKRYREIHGVGLAEAKSAVENLESRSDRRHGDQP